MTHVQQEWPPNLDALPEGELVQYQTKQVLRWLADRLNALRASVGSVSIESVSQQLAALTARVDLLERPVAPEPAAPTITPVVGVWEKTSTTAGVGSYAWDSEVLNQGQGGFNLQAGSTQVLLPSDGVYVVLATLGINNLAGAGAEGHLYKNAGVVARDFTAPVAAGAYAHARILHALQADAGEYLELKNSAGDRFGDANHNTRLVVFRLASLP